MLLILIYIYFQDYLLYFLHYSNVSVDMEDSKKKQKIVKKKSLLLIQCQLCSFQTKQMKIFEKHQIKEHETVFHKNKDDSSLVNGVYKCSICIYNSIKKECTIKHIQATHCKKQPYKCLECPYESTKRNVLTQHVDAVHKQIKQYQCDHCPYKGTLKKYLKKHIDTIHLKLYPYSCQWCSYKASQSGNLKSHILHHHKYKTKRASINEKVFNFLLI